MNKTLALAIALYSALLGQLVRSQVIDLVTQGKGGLPRQVLRRKPNNVVAALEFADRELLVSSDYRFTLTNGVEVSACDLSAAGVKTCTLTYSPLGVAGANTNHYIYVSAGTGTAEAVLITGGTCTSGQLSSCTMSFTTVNTHTGSWTLTSSSNGIQEAVKVSGSALTDLRIPAGTHNVFQTIRLDGFAGGIHGAGFQPTQIVSQFAAGNVFHNDTSVGGINNAVMTDMIFITGVTRTSGAFVYIKAATIATVKNIRMFQGFDGLQCENCNAPTIENVTSNEHRRYGIYLLGSSGASGAFMSNVGAGSSVASTVGLIIQTSGTATFSGTLLSNFISQSSGTSTIGISVDAAGGAVNELYMDNLILDSMRTAGIRLQGAAGGNGISIRGVRASPGTGADIVNISASTFSNISISGITGAVTGGADGIRVRGASNVKIFGNTISGSGNAADNCVEILTDGATVANNVSLMGNTLGFNEAGGTTGNVCAYGIAVSTGAHNKIIADGNLVFGSTQGVIWNSTGADNRILSHTDLAQVKPTCAAVLRGSLWYTPGGAGVLDKYEVCRKDAADAYAWTALF